MIGGPCFVKANIILYKLDEIITHNKVTINQRTGEREHQVLHIYEDIVSSEENILIVLKEERYNDYCGAIG